MTSALALFAVIVAAALVLMALPLEGGSFSVKARHRAKELFLSKLTPAERLSWERDRRLTVLSSSGRRYTLAPYQPYNIRRGEYLYCLRVAAWIPAYDKLLAQRLLIEADEERFLAVANRRELEI